MKNALVIVVFAACLSSFMVVSCDGAAAPRLQDAPDDALLDPRGGLSPEASDQGTGPRFRRVTCDLLSVSLPFVTLNHAACAAHCLVMNRGFTGGSCIGGVCNCRR